MKLGYFNDKDREYVITNPKTPYPYINYLGYEIIVNNPNHVSKGIKKIVVDGKEISGNIVPVLDEKIQHTVLVTMG